MPFRLFFMLIRVGNTQEEIYNRRSIAPTLPTDFQHWHDTGIIPKGKTGLVLAASAEH